MENYEESVVDNHRKNEVLLDLGFSSQQLIVTPFKAAPIFQIALNPIEVRGLKFTTYTEVLSWAGAWNDLVQLTSLHLSFSIVWGGINIYLPDMELWGLNH